MKKLFLIGLVSIFAFGMTSCVFHGPAPAGPGTLVTSHKSVKSGTAERRIWLNFSFGDTDLSTTTAAKNGGITKIATVDYRQKIGFLGIFSDYQTIVTGE